MQPFKLNIMLLLVFEKLKTCTTITTDICSRFVLTSRFRGEKRATRSCTTVNCGTMMCTSLEGS